MQREEPKALEESKNIQKPLSKAFLSLSAGFNAGGTADFILIISVPGYLSIPGLFVVKNKKPRGKSSDTVKVFRYAAKVRYIRGKETENGTGKRSKKI